MWTKRRGVVGVTLWRIVEDIKILKSHTPDLRYT